MSNILNCTGYELMDDNIVTASGCYVFNRSGKRYLDAESGVWCTILGHNHPVVNQAIINQTKNITHVGYRYSTGMEEETAALLLQTANMKNGRCVFLSSGSEAVELGIRIAKKITEKQVCLSLDKHYLAAYGQGYERNREDWLVIDWSNYSEEEGPDSFLRRIPFEKIGVFVFEPGNASGLAKLPPKKLITAIVSRIRANEGLIVVDEVTAGIGRAGRWFGYENYDFCPDIISCGKSLGNGYPVSAVIINEAVAVKVVKSGFAYAQSHQNDPLACAAAKAVLTVLKEEDFIAKSYVLGGYLQQQLKGLMQKYKIIREVRGIGLMQAIELKPEAGQNALVKIHRDMFEQGFIIGVKPAFLTLRFYPPLIIQKDMIDQLVNALEQTLHAVSVPKTCSGIG